MSASSAGDRCGQDSIRDRSIETASWQDQVALADRAWLELSAALTDRSAFHRAHFADHGTAPAQVRSVRDLPQLPTMTRADARAAEAAEPPFGSNLGVEPARVKLVFQTSGSTGRPGVVALTPSDLATWAAIGTRSYHATGVHDHHAVLTTLGAGPFTAGVSHATLDAIGARRVPVGPGDVERALSAMRSGIVDTMLTTPSFALHLAALLDERGIDGTALGVEHLVVGGEPGGGIPAIRDRLEEAFGAGVTEVSGVGEVSASLFGECSEKGGMHFCGQGLVWPELIDPGTGEPLAIEEGASGEMVYTTLVREAMPVVRFRSGDVVHITGTTCGCGRTSFRMRILGRSDDMFIVRGVNVFPSAIQSIVAEFEPRVTGRSRVVLPDGAGVTVDPPVVVEVEVPDGPAPGADVAAAIEAALRSRLVFRAAVELIPQSRFGDPGYKTRAVVRR